VQRTATSGAQYVPSTAAAEIGRFVRIVHSLRETHKYSVNDIFACDQTGLCPFVANTKTLEETGANTVRVTVAGNSKTNYSVMLCANAAGRKLPATVVLARTRPLTQIENANKRNLSLQYTGAGGTSWFDTDMCCEWLKKQFKVRFFCHRFPFSTCSRHHSLTASVD
jgi:hypothetical protein